MTDKEEIIEIEIKGIDLQTKATELWSPILEIKKKMKKLLDEIQYLESSGEAAKRLFWIEMKKAIPALEDYNVNWKFDFDDMKFTSFEEENRMPPFIKGIIGL